MPFAGPENKIPAGWLPCDGRTVNSATYPKLFANIGTTWGEEENITENGVTYFKLPDFRNRTLWGANQKELGTYVAAGLPNITGEMTAILDNANGCYESVNGKVLLVNGWATTNGRTKLDASLCSSIYGASDTVQPPAAAVNFIIKVDPTF